MAETKGARSAQKKGFDHFFFVRLIEKFVGVIRKILSPKLLDFCTRLLTTLGHYAIFIASCLAILIGIIGAIRLKSFEFFLYSLIFAIGIFVIQYIAKKFSHAGETLIENNPSFLSSSAFLDCLGLLAMLAGVVALLYHLYQAIRIPQFEPLLYGAGAFIFFEFVALVVLHPRTITVDVVDQTTAGEEAIGIITIFIKKIMRLIPILFGLGLIIVTVMLLIDSVGLFSELKKFAARTRILSDYERLVGIGLLPFLSYIGFVILYLVVDLIKAILSIPGKLDKLSK